MELPGAPVIDVVRPISEVGEAAQKGRGAGGTAAVAPAEVDFTLSPGARVVFTGTMSRPREEWARALADAGFVTGSVTKNCVALVAEDPATQSGKAKTARAHGIPIITEAQFIPAFEAFIPQRRIS